MTADGVVRVAILGCGFIARTYHVPALQQVREAQLVAFADPTFERASELAASVGLGSDASHTDPFQALARPDVDAALILTPNHTHRDLLLAAAATGKHTLVQKPLGRTSAECREMIRAARAAGTILAISFMHRYFPEVRLAREYLDRGLIGRVHTVRVRNGVAAGSWAEWFHRRDLTGGGVAIDVGVHGIDLIRYWCGEIESVQAQMITAAPRRQLRVPRAADPVVAEADNEDNVLALYRLASGTLGVHEMSWTERARSRRFEAEVHGEDGSMLVRSGLGPLAIASRRLDNGDQWVVPFLPYEPFGVRQHQAFCDAVLGRAPVDAPAEDGLATVQVVEALYRSAEAQNCPVPVEQRGL